MKVPFIKYNKVIYIALTSVDELISDVAVFINDILINETGLIQLEANHQVDGQMPTAIN